MERSGALNVYVDKITPRVEWVFRLMLEELLGLSIIISDEMPPEREEALLNYSGGAMQNAINLVPAGLLTDKGIHSQDIVIEKFEGLPVFFKVSGGDLPFDPFSMAFYLVSRYEEYLDFKADMHGRFPQDQSLAAKHGFIDKAIVNRLVLLVKDLIRKRYPNLEFNLPEYVFTPTVDVDIAFAHLGKGLVRTYGAMAKLVLEGNFREIRNRIRTMQGKTKDPFDNFDMLLRTFRKYDLDAILFILAGKRGTHDRNLSLKNKNFADLVHELSMGAEIGIHPSYASNSNSSVIKKEIANLRAVTGTDITNSRQHFIRMKFPETYRSLIKAGITDDYSMGYAAVSGFRASIASPFYFYDLEKEEETKLRIHPFMFMDATLDDYLGLGPEQYTDAISPIIREVKDCNGHLIGIWHNYALADEQEKHKAFKEIIELAAV